MLWVSLNEHKKSNYSGMKRIKLLVIIIGLMCMAKINAQVVNLRIVSSSLDSLSTVIMGRSDTVTLTIFNDSSSNYNGFISIGSNVNGTVDTLDSLYSGPVYFPSWADTEIIVGHGSISRALVFNVQNPPFIIGSSGVVIWPIAVNSANQVHISDSLFETITVINPSAVNEVDDKKLKVYVSDQQLIIQEDDQYLLKSAKLYDVEGAFLKEQKISISGLINMEPYAQGIYLVEITYADNARRVIKVFSPK
jgi:hypothetical protein